MNFQKNFLKIINALCCFLIISFFSCKKEKEPSNESVFSTQQVDKYYQLANNYYDNNKFDSAFYYANKIRIDINPKVELKKYATTMFIITVSQQMKGDYSGAENSIVETIASLQKTNTQKYKFKFFEMLANNYSFTKEYDNAIYYYKKARNYTNNEKNSVLNQLNIGHIYKEKNEYEKALQILVPLLNKKETKKNKYYTSGILNDIGYCYMKLDNPNALYYLKKSLELNSNMDSSADNDYDLTANYYNLHLYYLEHDKKTALNYAKLLYQKATEYNNPDDRLIALSLLTKSTNGNESKKYALKYISLNDSISQIRQKDKNYFAKLKYDSKKEKEENLKLKAEKTIQAEKVKYKNIISIFIILILIILSGFIYYYLIQKNKKEKLLTAYNTEIRIAKKLHDELANEIFQTINFAETQDLSSPKVSEKLLDNLDTIYATTRDISRENSIIETGVLYGTHLKEMISSFNSKTVNIMINGLEEIDWITISKLKKITIYRIVQELLVNMKKHSKSTLVLLSFKKDENKFLVINYYDNGIGINFEKIVTKNGIQNIENRISTIDGTITFDSNQNKGVKTNIVIPT